MLLPETVCQDLLYGIRMLRRNIGFTVVAVLALAIGIGINTAVFTVYKGMVARPLDARDPGTMVNLALIHSSGQPDSAFSFPDYEAYRDTIRSFSGVIAFSLEQMTLSHAGGVVSQRESTVASGLGKLGLARAGAGNAEMASVVAVSENYFKVVAIPPVRGRTFESTSRAAASPSVLISENYWQKRFAGDRAVLGKTIHLNGVPVTIIGVTPHNFVGTTMAVPDFWLPLSLEPLVHADERWLADRENQRLRLFARLAPGATIARAQAEMNSVANHLRTLHDPRSLAAKPVSVLVWQGCPFPLPVRMYRGLVFTILLIMFAAGMVLLIACANVASLQLARARSRESELHTRLALGASRSRVIRQLLTESALLGLVAGAQALLSSWALLKVFIALAANAFPPDQGTLVVDVSPDFQTFAYAFFISLLAGVLFGLTPAIESSRVALSSSVRANTSSARSRRLQNILVAAQVALSLALLIAGSMLIRTSVRSLKTETGYDSKQVIGLDLRFPESSRYTADRKLALMRELRTRLSALAGVVSVTSARPPAAGGFRTAAVSLDSDGASADIRESIFTYTYVQANYFSTLGIPLLLGGSFPPASGSPYTAVVSDSVAKQLWPGQNPIGRRLRLGLTDERIHNRSELVADGLNYQVIGIARDTRGVQFDGSDSKQVYLPLLESQLQDHSLLIRVRPDPVKLMKAMDPVISSVDPGLIATSATLNYMLRQSPPFLASTLAAAIASIVGVLGLLLASMGIYGTVSYIVVLRTREIGIRMAVGAQKRAILQLILHESTQPVFAGLLVGMVLASGVSYLLRGVLYGGKIVDGAAYMGVSLLFLVIALLASSPPSRRAMRVDPVVALREE
jgi:predicted permease